MNVTHLHRQLVHAGAPAVEAAEGDEADEDEAAEENALAAAAPSPEKAKPAQPRKEQPVRLLDAAVKVDKLPMHR